MTARLSVFLFWMLMVCSQFASAASNQLLLDFPFDEGTGTTVSSSVLPVDEFGVKNSGVLQGNLWDPAGYHNGSALHFSSNATDRCDINITADSSETTSFTVSAWIYLDPVSVASGQRRFIVDRGYSWRLFVTSDWKIAFQTNNNGNYAGHWITTNNPISANAWVYVTAVWDGHRRSIYVNGILDNYSDEDPLVMASKSLQVGYFSSSTDYSLHGKIDRLRVWGYALSADEITQSKSDDPIARYPMDEGQGTVVNNAVTPGTNTATISGVPQWEPGFVKGNALAFRGAADIASVTSPTTSIDTPNNAMTISAWVKLDATTNTTRRFLVQREYSWRVFIDANRRVFYQIALGGNWPQNWLGGNTQLPTDKWQHVAVVWDGTTRKIFINGVLDNSDTPPGTLGQTTSAVDIGNSRTEQNVEFDGAISDLQLWNTALSNQQVLALVRDALPEQRLSIYKGVFGSGDAPRIDISNPGLLPVNGDVSVSLGGLAATQTVSLLANGKASLTFPLATSSGELTYTWKPADFSAISYSRSESVWVTPPKAAAATGELNESNLTLVDQIYVDCNAFNNPLCLSDTTKFVSYPGSGYEPSAVSSTLLYTAKNGSSSLLTPSYLQGGNNKWSRFAIKYKVSDSSDLNTWKASPNYARPYLVRIYYPDDMERTADIINWSSDIRDTQSAQTGYLTGSPYPITNTIQKTDIIVYPRAPEQALEFTTWEANKPAAFQKIEVYRINDVANGELRLPSAALTENQRQIGLYYEDPMISDDFGGTASTTLAGFQTVADNLVDYLNYSGQNLLTYPIVWYHSPLYQSKVESYVGEDGVDRHPPNDFVEMLLQRFSEHNKKLLGIYNVHTLPSLLRNMQADESSILSGSPTYNLVLGVPINGQHIQKTDQHGNPPVFNILQPEVQSAFKAVIQETLDRYGQNPSFGGIVFHMPKVSALWLGSLQGGYSDWDIQQYRGQVQTAIPDYTGATRFESRYSWLTTNEKSQWVNWRCGRLRNFYSDVLQMITTTRPDLRLVLELHSPPNGHSASDVNAWASGVSAEQSFREAGICMEDYGTSDMAGLSIQKVLFPQGYRILRATQGLLDTAAEQSRELDFSPQLQAFRKTDPFGIVMHQSYWESNIGQTNPIPNMWWGDMPWRAAAITASGRSFMEYYGHTLADFNADEIAVGGFSLGPIGHEEDVRDFARVFRSLPPSREAWQSIISADLAGLVDIRYLPDSGGASWLSLVNKKADPKLVKIQLGQSATKVTDLATGIQLSPVNGTALFVSLRPYDLAGYRIEPVNVGIVSAASTTTSDLSVSMTSNATSSYVGNLLTYTATVSNTGPYGATNVTFTDALPANVILTSAVSSQGTCTTGSIVVCSVGSLSSGASATVTISVIPMLAGSLSNTVSVVGAEYDPNTANNSATVTTSVNPAADLSIVATVSPNPVNVNGQVTYTVTVTNTGPSNISGVVVSDPLPAGINFVSASAGCIGSATVTCNIGNLASGASASLTITATPTVTGSLSSTITVAGVDYDPNVTNNSTPITITVNPVTDLSVSQSLTPNPVVAGGSLSIAITASNAGPSPASGVTVTDTLPAGVTYVSASPNICSNASGVVSCNVGNLANGTNATITFTVTPTVPGTLTNTVSVTGGQTDLNTANNSATATTTVNAPDLVPTAMSASKSGSKVYISDTVTNQGNGSAGAFSVSYYLSTDTGYSTDDLPLVSTSGGSTPCTRSVSSLDVGATSSVSNMLCYKPGNAVTGQRYYVLVVDDSTNQVIESNESNNVKATTGTVWW